MNKFNSLVHSFSHSSSPSSHTMQKENCSLWLISKKNVRFQISRFFILLLHIVRCFHCCRRIVFQFCFVVLRSLHPHNILKTWHQKRIDFNMCMWSEGTIVCHCRYEFWFFVPFVSLCSFAGCYGRFVQSSILFVRTEHFVVSCVLVSVALISSQYKKNWLLFWCVIDVHCLLAIIHS